MYGFTVYVSQCGGVWWGQLQFDGSSTTAVRTLAGHRRYSPFEKEVINGSVTPTGCELSPIHAGVNTLWHDGLCVQYKEPVFVFFVPWWDCVSSN